MRSTSSARGPMWRDSKPSWSSEESEAGSATRLTLSGRTAATSRAVAHGRGDATVGCRAHATSHPRAGRRSVGGRARRGSDDRCPPPACAPVRGVRDRSSASSKYVQTVRTNGRPCRSASALAAARHSSRHGWCHGTLTPSARRPAISLEADAVDADDARSGWGRGVGSWRTSSSRSRRPHAFAEIEHLLDPRVAIVERVGDVGADGDAARGRTCCAATCRRRCPRWNWRPDMIATDAAAVTSVPT